ncbi:MAG: cytochrome c biogenesis protein ResB [Gammaproteobacteria bacterium]|nr:cytochrome c biogenesis protein ResB [Gammaproteobacteria bacterium]
MNATQNKRVAQRSMGRILLEFLGSMNLAITLLVALSIASVIGTVLQQNQAYTGYLSEFGPFWFEVFEHLGLYDIYGTAWFWAILAFLLVSTSVCVYRNAPGMLRDMRQYRLNVQEKSLRNFHNVREWRFEGSADDTLKQIQPILKLEGYKARLKDHGDHLVLAAKKGAFNRMGYLLTHVSIVVICIGAALDANIGLKFQLATGQKVIETRDIMATEVPDQSFLDTDNSAFRGSVYISEGGTSRIAFIGVKEGYLVQRLPFLIELKEFRTEHYPSGQPKSFESDLVIHDPEREEPLETTIAVNHPLVYKGYAIYQADFRDGGSELDLRAWGLFDGGSSEVEGKVNQSYNLSTPLGDYVLEVEDFRLFNIDQAPEGHPSGKERLNYGPSFSYKLRDAQGQANEYNTFMQPMIFDGRNFFLTGVRTEVGGPMRFLHFPADDKLSLDRFMNFREAMTDEARVRRIVTTQMMNMARSVGVDEETQAKAANSIITAVQRFVRGGYDAVSEGLSADDPELEQRVQAMLNVLVAVFRAIYVDVLEQEGIDTSQGISDAQIQFFDDSLNAMSAIHRYGSPVFLQLQDFKHIEASGLQIARAPWTNLVYLGCLMLIIGVFFMFYIHHKRVWVWMSEQDGQTRVLFAGSGDRDLPAFKADFDALAGRMEKLLKPIK